MKKEVIKNRVDKFLTEEKYNEKSTNTLVHYKHVIELFLETLKNEEITKDDIMDFKEDLLKRYKPKTVSNYITIANKFIKFNEIMDSNGEYEIEDLKELKSKLVVKNIKIQNESSLEDVLESTEFKRLLRTAKKLGQIEMYLVMKIFGYTGIRVGELKFFTVENIVSNYIRVRNKGKIRTIILRNDLKNELMQYCKENGIETGYIFVGKKEGTMLHETTIFKRLKKIAGKCRGIKIDKVHAHSFRHLFAIKFIEDGGTLTELADIFGHASVETTRIYVRTTENMKRKKMEKMKY